MYPVVPALPRTVTNSFELGGYTAPVLPVLDRESRCNRLLLPAGAERADDLVLPVLEGSRDLLVVGAEEPAHDLEGLEAAVPQGKVSPDHAVVRGPVFDVHQAGVVDRSPRTGARSPFSRWWRRIPVVFADEVLDALADECIPVAVKRVAEATSLPEFEHPERAMYLFGPENGSLDESMLERCAHVVSIPGRECSNLAAAVNVVLYDRVAKRWAHMRDAFPPTDGLLRGVRGGYEARLDIDD